MKKIVLIILCFSYLLGASQQFYMIAKFTRLGSYTNEGSNKTGIFIRWDTLEGSIPEEIAYFKLIKNIQDRNTTLIQLDTNGYMPKKPLEEFLFSKENMQELYDIIEALNTNDHSTCNNANIYNIVQKIQSCSQHNSLWAFLASRTFFSVALARNRAYLDKEIPKDVSTVTYYLLGIDRTKTKSMLLGKVDVNLTQKRTLPKAANLQQIISSSCNDNRFGLDDMRVALRWERGGNKSEQFIDALSLAGYDIFYSTKSVENLPPNFAKTIDIADLGVKLQASQNPNWQQFGIAKANKALVTLSQKKPDEPVYIETQKELLARGFLPGEKRYYFVAPKDFSGKYGPTASIVVTIPDLLPPPKPFLVRAAENNVSIDLLWQAPTLQTFSNYYKYDLTLCLSKSLPQANRYHFIGKDESCQKEEDGFDVQFNIDKFYVYRFSNFDEAVAFEDRDLDGVNDKDETNATLCTQNYPQGSKRYLIAKVKNDGNTTIVFRDKSIKTSQVYWYRIASVTKSGVASYLTAPIRAFVPKRGVEDAPKFNATIQKGYEILLDTPQKDIFTIDATKQNEVARVKLHLPNKSFTLIKNSDAYYLPNEFLTLSLQANDYIDIVYFNTQGRKLLQKRFSVAQLFALSDGEQGNITTLLHTLAFKERFVPFKEGESVPDGCIRLQFSDTYYQKIKKEHKCIGIQILINNKRYRLKESCNVNKVEKVCIDGAKNGDIFSLRIYSYDPNTSLYSQPTYLTLRLRGVAEIHPPYITALTLDKTQGTANISYIRSFENIDAIDLELYQKGGKKRYHKFVAQGNTQKGTVYSVQFDKLLLADGDMWCIRGKSITREGYVSEWSEPVCQEIGATLSQENMSWPKIADTTTIEESKKIIFEKRTKKVLITLLQLEPFQKDYNACTLAEAIQALPHFIVYRQRIFEDGTKGKFVQVSPLIADVPASCEQGAIVIGHPNIEIRDKVNTEGILEIVYVDQYPYIQGAQYRYIILGFNPITNEIASQMATIPQVVHVQ